MARLPTGVSTGISILTLLVVRSLLHGPMTLLANLVACLQMCDPSPHTRCCGGNVLSCISTPCRCKRCMKSHCWAQVALVLPFMRLGELLLGAPQLPITPVSIMDVIKHHQGRFI